MFNALLRKLIGSKNDRELKKIRPLIEEINRLEPELAELSLEGLRAKTEEFRSQIQTATQALRASFAEAQARVLQGEDEEERTQLKAESEKLEKELRQAQAS